MTVTVVANTSQCTQCSVVAMTIGGVGDASKTAEERTAEDGKDHQGHGL